VSRSKSPTETGGPLYSPRRDPVLPIYVDRPSLRSVSVYLGQPPKQPFLSTVIPEIAVAGFEVCCWAGARTVTDKPQKSGTESLTPLCYPLAGTDGSPLIARAAPFRGTVYCPSKRPIGLVAVLVVPPEKVSCAYLN
jgi:hypothetical protein